MMKFKGRTNPDRPLSTKKRSSGCLLVPFGLIFVVAGLALFYFLSFRPLAEWQDAQQWPERPCTVLESEVVTVRSDDGTTYRVEVTYEYEYNGKTYSSKRYNFFTGSSSGRAGKEAIVAGYPQGAQSRCFVNPETPSEAVLNRDFSFTYLIGSFGLLFIVVGGFVAYAGIADKKKPPLAALLEQGTAPDPLPLKLKPGATPMAKVLGALFFALIWNGIVWTGIILAWDDAPNGFSGVFIVLFLSLFVLVGLFLVGNFFKEVLALLNPRPILTLKPGGIQLGQEAQIDWHFTGATGRIAKMRVWLEGCERATYRRGTKTVTDESVFEKLLIMESDNFQDMRSGRVRFAMPEFTMHSFETDNNEVRWKIMVHGDIKRWPDIDFHFPVQVYPLPPIP